MQVSEASARELVQQAAREGKSVSDHPPHALAAKEDTGQVARRLVEAIHESLQAPGSQWQYLRTLMDELAARESQSSAEKFASAAKDEWIRQRENGYPDSALKPEDRPRQHGSPGHICWDPTSPDWKPRAAVVRRES
jgi:hypothetical protein